MILVSVMAMIAVALVLMEPTPDVEPAMPEVEFAENRTRGDVVVESVLTEAAWDEFQVRLSKPGGFVLSGQEMARPDPMVFESVAKERAMQEGDRIVFCEKADDSPMEVVLRHEASGEMLAKWTFVALHHCDDLEPEA